MTASLSRTGHLVAASSDDSATTDADELIRIHRELQDRSAWYQFALIQDVLAEGRQPRLTRAGWRNFYLHRAAYRSPIDMRAAEVVAARITQKSTPARTTAVEPDRGMTLVECAKWLGVSRTNIGKHVVVIPPGPVPPLPPGKIPARLIGNVRRFFVADFQGLQTSTAGVTSARDQEAPTSPSTRSSWDRQIAELRDRYAPRE